MATTTSTTSPARPGVRAHIESTRLPFADLVTKLTGVIGKKLTAYIAGKNDVRSVDRWMQGQGSYSDAELRLRFAYQIVKSLAEHDSPAVVQSWLTGINPELRDRTPIRLLREADLDVVGPELRGAARAFIAGG